MSSSKGRSWGSALAIVLANCADPQMPSPPETGSADGAISSPVTGNHEPLTAVISDHEQIRWQGLEPDTFEAAHREDRMVLLSMISPWGGADPMATAGYALRALVEDRFIPIQIDPLRRPDIARRYAPAGWPALAVTLPDGQLVATATDIPKDNIHQYLLSLANHYRDRPDDVVSRAKAFRVASSNRGHALPVTVSALHADMVREHDSVHGGFGSGAKFPETSVLRFLLSYYELYRDEQALGIALQGLEVLTSVPMWDDQKGGVLSYSFTPDWLTPIAEKDAADQAGLFEALRHARQLSGATSSDSAARLRAYIRGELFDAERGVFHGRQVRRGGRLSSWWTDPTVYTDRNALLILACLRAGPADMQSMALAATAYLMENCVRPDGAVFHCVTENGAQAPGLLQDQMLTAQALWEAHRVSGRDEFAGVARRILKWTETNLYDAQEQAFIDGIADPAIPAWRPRIRFADEAVPAGNATAAALYLAIGHPMASDLLSGRVFDSAVRHRRSYASYGRTLLQWTGVTRRAAEEVPQR